jgi:hypothetical protein
MLKQFKRLYNFYFRISAIIFGKQSIFQWLNFSILLLKSSPVKENGINPNSGKVASSRYRRRFPS